MYSLEKSVNFLLCWGTKCYQAKCVIVTVWCIFRGLQWKSEIRRLKFVSGPNPCVLFVATPHFHVSLLELMYFVIVKSRWVKWMCISNLSTWKSSEMNMRSSETKWNTLVRNQMKSSVFNSHEVKSCHRRFCLNQVKSINIVPEIKLKPNETNSGQLKSHWLSCEMNWNKVISKWNQVKSRWNQAETVCLVSFSFEYVHESWTLSTEMHPGNVKHRFRIMFGSRSQIDFNHLFWVRWVRIHIPYHLPGGLYVFLSRHRKFPLILYPVRSPGHFGPLSHGPSPIPAYTTFLSAHYFGTVCNTMIVCMPNLIE